MFKALVQNDQAMTVVIAIVLINGALYITSNLLIYFFKYDVGGAKWYDSYTLFNTVGGATQILSMMIIFPFMRKLMSTIRVFYVSVVMAISGYVLLFILMFTGATSMIALLIPGILIFIAFGMLTVLTTVFLANTVDYGEVKNGRRDESVIFSMQTFVVKLASGVSAFIASICLTICNLSNDTSNVVVEVSKGANVMGLRFAMSALPIIGLIVALILFAKKYILTDEKLEEITQMKKK